MKKLKDITDKDFDDALGITEYIEPDEYIEEDDEDEICSWCSGSGEGMYDGATCGKCHGSGIEPREKDDDC